MKPVKLTMQAYGPYAGFQELDFRKLSGASLYLICGETGAGKSTIFDAIAYALYGEDAGTGNLHRSKYAGEDTETYVHLVFLHQGRQWEVIRKPAQELTKRRGTGTRTVPASVELTCPDGRIITRIEQVKEEITQTLGLTAAQFKQVIMIAQGKFDEVLHTKSDERQAILRNIMDTKFYVRLQERLKEDTRKAREDVEALRAQIKSQKDSVQIPADHPLADQAPLLTDPGRLPAEVLDLVGSIIAADEEALVGQRRQQETQREALTTAELLWNQAREAESLRGTIRETEAAIRQLTENRGAQEAAVTAAQGRQDEARALRSEASALGVELPRFDQVEQLDRELAGQRKALGDLKADAGRYEARLSDVQQRHGGALQEEQSLRDVPDRLMEAARRQSGLEQLGKDLKKVCDGAKTLERQRGEERRAQEAYLRADEDYRGKHQRDEALQQLYNDAQAGILAARLREGVACPVCGSPSHPHPAPPPPADVPDEAALKLAREQAEAAREFRDAASRKAGEAGAARRTTEEALQADLQALPEDLRANLPTPAAPADLDRLLMHTRAQYLDAANAYREWQGKQARLTALRQQLPALAEQEQQAREALHRAQQAETKAQTVLDETARQLDALRRQLPFPTRQALIARQQQALRDAGQIEEELDQAAQRLQRTKEQLAARSAALASDQQRLRELPALSVAETEARREAARQAHQQALNRTASLEGRLNTNRRAREKLESGFRTLEAKEARLKWLDALNKTANGQITTRKITLETFVQLRLFDRILHRANQHLRRMSDGQYTLVRATGQQGNRDTSLDLDVLDSMNGTQRSSVTLSGGESFQASLALALGFSDEIQSSAGGIQLDTLFIDEGFGTLSEDWLNRAIATLQGLSGSSRQVGIISHVADLQRRIERKIVVRKSPRRLGSEAHIE